VWKWIVGLLVLFVLVLGAGAFVLFGTPQGKKLLEQIQPKAKPTEVRLETTGTGPLTRTVSAPGRVEPKTDVDISAQIAARILALPFRENDEVKKGDVLVRLDARDALASLESSQANLKGEEARVAGAKAALAWAKLELDRQTKLAETNDTATSVVENAQSEFLRAQSSLAAAEHAVEQARANIARAEKDVDNTVITAPMDGTIVALNAEVGELVLVGTLNNPASVILRLADLSEMLMKARVDQSNIAPVQPGQTARVFLNAYPDRKLTGVVERVRPQRQQEQDGTVYFETEILLKIEPGERLAAGKTGLDANADIEVETLHDVIKVPSQAVVDRRTDELPVEVREGPNANLIDKTKAFTRIVFVLGDDSKVKATPVTAGASDLTHTVILAGLSPGQRIVTGPFKVLIDLKHDQLVAEEGALKKDADSKGVDKKDADSKPDDAKAAAAGKP
jgi:HlyD family secretion protein